MIRSDIYAAIDEERARQAKKWNRPHAWGWGDCSSPSVDVSVKVAVLAEELGEVARSTLESDAGLRAELVQLAACCVAWLEAL